MATSSRDIELLPREGADSRGRPTVEVELRLGSLRTLGDVPAGETRGGDEAQTVPVPQAIANIREVIQPLLREAAADLSQHTGLLELEQRLIARAGPNCADLGANAVLPVSRALWRIGAALQGIELFEYIRRFEPELAGSRRVLLFLNVFNGGYHAIRKAEGEVLGRDRIDFQELQIVPVSAGSYREGLAMAEKVDQTLKGLLSARCGASRVSRADEAGLSVKGLGDNALALDHVVEAIRAAGFEPGRDVKITLDPASSHLYDARSGRYTVGGRHLDPSEFGGYLLGLLDRHPGAFMSVEDPLEENDWEGLARLAVEIKKRNVLVVGDDFYVTQRRRLEKGIADGSANGLLVKPNQNGDLHGTFEVMKLARRHGIELVISHRSGETLDDSIADIAIATGAFGIKTGAPLDFKDRSRWVRRVKYLRMIQIEEGEEARQSRP